MKFKISILVAFSILLVALFSVESYSHRATVNNTYFVTNKFQDAKSFKLDLSDLIYVDIFGHTLCTVYIHKKTVSVSPLLYNKVNIGTEIYVNNLYTSYGRYLYDTYHMVKTK